MKIEEIRILRIGIEGHLKTIFEKFGSYEPYFDDVVSDGLFVRYSPDGTFNGTIRLKHNLYYAESDCSDIDFIDFWKVFCRIVRLVKKFEIKLIHINSVKDYPWIFSALAASNVLDVPLVSSIHSDYLKRDELTRSNFKKLFNSSWVSQKIFNWFMRQCDGVCPIRHSLMDYPKKAGVPEGRIFHFPHSVDAEQLDQQANKIDVRSMFGLSSEHKIISHVGRLDSDNYIWDVFSIMSNLCEENPDYRGVICGRGELERTLHDEIKKPGLEERVIIAGSVERAVGYAIRKASMVNLCLMGGFSLIEACLSGKPVISYDVEWHSALIEDGKTGYLLEEGDWPSALERVCQLDNEHERRRAMGTAGRSRALEKYSPGKVKKQKQQIYQMILKDYGAQLFSDKTISLDR